MTKVAFSDVGRGNLSDFNEWVLNKGMIQIKAKMET